MEAAGQILWTKHSLSQRESDEFVPARFQEMLDVFLSDGAAERQKQGEGWKTATYKIHKNLRLISRDLNSNGQKPPLPSLNHQREPKPFVCAVQLHGNM